MRFAQPVDPRAPPQRQEDERTRAFERTRTFLGFVGLANPATRFIVYRTEQERQAWVSDTVQRFPSLRDRVRMMSVAGEEKASFRAPATRAQVRREVESILGDAAR